MDIKREFAKLCFSASVRQRTWHKLAAQLRYDVSLEYALSIIRDRYRTRKEYGLVFVFDHIITTMQSGESLDVAVRDFVSTEEALLLQGGHLSGRLQESLELCVTLIEAQKSIRQAVISATVYPFVLLAMFVTVLVVLSLHVVPALGLLADTSAFTGAAKYLFELAAFVASPWGIVTGVALILLVIIALVSLPYWTGRSRLYVESIPPWSVYRLVIGTMWLFTIATNLRANIPIVTTLTRMTEYNVRPWLRERIDTVLARLAYGSSFAQALTQTGLNFPAPEMVDDILVYASLPSFEGMLHSFAQEWLDTGIQSVKEQSTVLNTVLLLSIVGLMIFLGIAIVSMQQQLNAQMNGM